MSLPLTFWVAPMIASEVKTSIAIDCPHFIAKVRAAKNIPSLFSPVVRPSASATSATIACGIMPSSAIGKAAITQIATPKTAPGRTLTLISAVIRYASASPRKPAMVSFFFPNLRVSPATIG